MLIGLYLISVLCNLIQSWLMAGVAQKVTYNLRNAAKVDRLPLSDLIRTLMVICYLVSQMMPI